MEKLTGQLDEIIFTNDDNGFSVAKLRAHNTEVFYTIVGNLASAQPGETLSLTGEWKKHATYGKQFEIASVEIRSPSDLLGLKKYFESGFIRGIGPVYAKKIIDHFGILTLDILDLDPSRLLEVDGIGKKRMEVIKKCLEEQKSIRKIMVFLRGHGIGPAFSLKIFKKYEEKSIEYVKENPYRLSQEIFGIGFKIADSIAQNLGFEKNSEKRIEAGVNHLFFELSQEGHTCFYKEDFIQKACEMLSVEKELVEKCIRKLIQQQKIFQEQIDQKIFLWHRLFYNFEKAIAKKLEILAQEKSTLRKPDTKKALLWVEEQLKIRLAPEQMNAVEKALFEKVLIITGGPGTGKSTITKAILKISEKLTSKIFLAAPTGRAAKRLTEITKKKAFTIHALLEYDFMSKGFRKNQDFLLACDLIILDEVSMVDTALFYHLLLALPIHTRLILVGDVDQLPSVGAGNLLKDLINSKNFPTVRLIEIFRQAKQSLIVQNAHKINAGQFPILTTKNSDFLFYEFQEPEEIKNKIISLIQKELVEKTQWHPLYDIQLLCPMKRGILGTENFNILLQQMLNPSDEPLFRQGKRFHLHDKVMQIRNNYSKQIFNGDIGIISSIDRLDQKLSVDFDGKKVLYDFVELDELMLAYAVSVHKYQGSEYPCIIMPVHISHFKLLYKNLLYTAVTRGKKLVILVGTKKALAIAIKNEDASLRTTGLKHFLGKKLLFPTFQS